MNAIRTILVCAAIILTGITACNYTVGECWPVGEGGGSSGVGVTAGGGVIVPTGPAGSGDYGAPPKQPQDAPNPKPEIKCNSDDSDETETETETTETTETTCNAGGAVNDGTTFNICSDACKTPCSGVNGYSPSIFNFITTVPDTGTGKSGGWQEAKVVLQVRRWTGILPETWDCPQMTFGALLRNTLQGNISPKMAAAAAADAATEASHEVKDIEEHGILCFKLKELLKVTFPAKISGASVSQP